MSADWMQIAFQEAKEAFAKDEVPVGAVIIDESSHKILARAHNLTKANRDPASHAEFLAIQEACKLQGSERLKNCSLYVTLEPCAMCAALISFARIDKVYFGAYDSKSGGTPFFSHKNCHFSPEIYGGILEEKCRLLLQKFFKIKRS